MPMLQIGLLLLGTATAFAPPLPRRIMPRQPITTTTQSMTLRPLFDDLCQKVGTHFDLKYTDFTAVLDGQTWDCPTAAGTAEWLDEANSNFVTGVSFLTRDNDPTVGLVEELTMNIWTSPNYDIPHMLLTFGEAGEGQYYVTQDYVPRGPHVLGRDPAYLERYYGAAVQRAWLAAYPPPGQASYAFPLRPSYEFDSRVLDSPCRISVVGLDARLATQLATDHVNRYLDWTRTAPPLDPSWRQAYRERDETLRQFYFRGQYQLQSRLLGEELGAVVAAVNTGPTAEAALTGRNDK